MSMPSSVLATSGLAACALDWGQGSAIACGSMQYGSMAGRGGGWFPNVRGLRLSIYCALLRPFYYVCVCVLCEVVVCLVGEMVGVS